MITEDRVPFEIAKLLEEKGFKGEFKGYYDCNGFYFDTPNIVLKESGYAYYPIPSLSVVLKWIREVYKIHIYATYNEDKGFQPKIVSLETGDNYITETFNGFTFEAVILYAIKYTLENLI